MENFIARFDTASGANIFARLCCLAPLYIECKFKKWDSVTNKNLFFLNIYEITVDQNLQDTENITDNSFYLRCVTRECNEDIKITKKLQEDSQDKYDYYLYATSTANVLVSAFDQGRFSICIEQFRDTNTSAYTVVKEPLESYHYNNANAYPLPKGRIVYDTELYRPFFSPWPAQLNSPATDKRYLAIERYSGIIAANKIIDLDTVTVEDPRIVKFTIAPVNTYHKFSVTIKLRSYWEGSTVVQSPDIIVDSDQDITDGIEFYKKGNHYYVKLLLESTIISNIGSWKSIPTAELPSDVENITGIAIFKVGDTAHRPSPYATYALPLKEGMSYYDTTIHKPIWYNGTNWVDASGTIV